ncbi:MAG: peptide ABC transporter substrate-binding protein [Chloroflexota bacterium]|nr:peptide ABC transporter substrate-binding protein [Chloroflexota bacterium]
MTRRDKLIVLSLIGLLVVTSVVAILTDRSDASASMPAFGGTYVEGVAGVPQYLNPIIAATSVDRDASRLLFTGLTRYDRNGAIVPDIAAAFRTADARVWSFEIRPDATWHDGVEVTADDVVFTVGLLQDRAYVGPYRDAFRGVAVEALGPKSVRFTLPEAYGPFADSTTVPLLPSHLLVGISYPELARQSFNASPVGTGPFKASELDGRQIVLVRNASFYGTAPDRARPYLDRVVLRFYSDTSDALAALARGEVDGVGGIATGDAERARTLRNVDLYSFPTNDFTAMYLNVRPEKAVFRDRAVRQAIATAIDRGRVMQVSIGGRGTLADEFVQSTSWAYVKDVTRYSYSLASAKAMLDEAGWTDHDGDGVRDRDGVPLMFSVTTSDEAARVTSGLQIVGDLNAAGMKVELATLPFGELVDKTARQRTFDALLVGVTIPGDPDPYGFFHSSQAKDPGHNFSGYSTLPLDRDLELARRTFDLDARRALYAPVFQAIATDVPVVFLYFADYLYAMNRSVHGLKVATINDPMQRFWNAADWYVRTAPAR